MRRLPSENVRFLARHPTGQALLGNAPDRSFLVKEEGFIQPRPYIPESFAAGKIRFETLGESRLGYSSCDLHLSNFSDTGVAKAHEAGESGYPGLYVFWNPVVDPNPPLTDGPDSAALG